MNCKNCQQEFIITNQDKEFYNRIKVPEPTFCPDCREQRRIASRNERSLYARQCDMCRKNIISIYDKDVKFPVYCPDCWWSDKWDYNKFSVEYNPNESFFKQYNEFSSKIPHISMMNRRAQNSDFVNETNSDKNCYLVFGVDYSENSFYGSDSIKMKNCVDFYWCGNSEQCYENIDSVNCYNSHFCQFSENLTDSWFCYDCAGCQNCFACAGIHHKQYYIFNKQYSEQEYNEKIKSYNLHTHEGLEKAKQEYEEFLVKYPRRYTTGVKIENCTGDVLVNCEDCTNAFDVAEGKNLKYAYAAYNIKDSYDISISGLEECELLYETMNCIYKNYNIKFSTFCWYSNNLEYCQYCFNSQDCFASYGLKKAKYYIFNKEYSETEYKKIKQEIIDKMRAQGEYGEYWPVTMSPFSYNETYANDRYSLTKNQVLALGWKWKDESVKPVNSALPICSQCEQNFKLLPQEIDFYKLINVPEPKKCPNCRHHDRMKKKNPRKLYQRECMCRQTDHDHQGKCTNQFETTYSPDRPETVYCDQCYRKSIY